jgi:hypothetical protein
LANRKPCIADLGRDYTAYKKEGRSTCSSSSSSSSSTFAETRHIPGEITGGRLRFAAGWARSARLRVTSDNPNPVPRFLGYGHSEPAFSRRANHHPKNSAARAASPLATWNDRNDLLHDITAGAAGSTSQQISHRSADLRFSVIRAPKTPNRPDLT